MVRTIRIFEPREGEAGITGGGYCFIWAIRLCQPPRMQCRQVIRPIVARAGIQIPGDLDASIELHYITYTFSYIKEGTMAIAVYSTPSCSYCRMVKDWLKQRNLRFDEYNVASDQRRAEEMVRKSGQMGVPVTDINGRIIIGFNTTELERALK
jgi:glutaredoxin-like YruB-family protein